MKITYGKTALLCVLICSSGLFLGCQTPFRGHAVPSELQNQAMVPGMTDRARTWGDEISPQFLSAVIDSVHIEMAEHARAGHSGPLPPANFLAISGGGANGAFGAGLICGWTQAGDRPQFKLITGISTGALIAPFVFAGPEYDHVLREVYTKTSTRDILKKRSILAAIFSDALSDSAPLWSLMSQYVDQKLLDTLAAEYHKGRLLVIGTTNLDARKAVLWNIGEIAASGHPDALELVRKIMIASAAIPAAFPPVMIDVEVDGAKYQEMHVDGGAMSQVFLYPPSLDVRAQSRTEGIVRERRAYIIRNARLDPEWAEVERKTLSIAERAISSLIQTQGVGDLYKIYISAERDGVDFNLAYIPATFAVKSKEPFDKEYMTQLFQLAFDLASSGYPWQKEPPGYQMEAQQAQSGPSTGNGQ